MSIFGIKRLTPSMEINDERSFSLEGITEMQVNMTKEQVHIIRAETSGEVKFHYYGRSGQELKLSSEIKDGRAVIGTTRRTNLRPEDLYLDIYLPQDYEKNILLNVSSGNLRAAQFKADKIFIHTSSGDIRIKELEAVKLEIAGKSSAVSIDKCIAKESRIETTSGKITLKNSKGSLILKASSGEISVDYKDFQEQNIKIVTTTGGIRLQLPRTAEFLLEATTSTGKLQSEFPVSMHGTKKMTGRIGTKSNKVMLQTSTGGINILKK